MSTKEHSLIGIFLACVSAAGISMVCIAAQRTSPTKPDEGFSFTNHSLIRQWGQWQVEQGLWQLSTNYVETTNASMISGVWLSGPTADQFLAWRKAKNDAEMRRVNPCSRYVLGRHFEDPREIALVYEWKGWGSPPTNTSGVSLPDYQLGEFHLWLYQKRLECGEGEAK